MNYYEQCKNTSVASGQNSLLALFKWKSAIKRILHTSPKITFQKLHFPEKHLAETILTRLYIFLNVHLPDITFPWTCTWQKLHFPERALARNYIFLNVLLPEFAFSKTCTCQKLHFRKEGSFGRIYIWPKLHFPENFFFRIYIWPKLHFPENIFSRNYIWPKLHFPENIFREFMFSRNYISPKTYIFQKLYTSARNFITDRIYITQICNYDCLFSKIIKLRLTRTTKGAKEGILSRRVTNFEK